VDTLKRKGFTMPASHDGEVILEFKSSDLITPEGMLRAMKIMKMQRNCRFIFLSRQEINIGNPIGMATYSQNPWDKHLEAFREKMHTGIAPQTMYKMSETLDAMRRLPEVIGLTERVRRAKLHHHAEKTIATILAHLFDGNAATTQTKFRLSSGGAYADSDVDTAFEMVCPGQREILYGDILPATVQDEDVRAAYASLTPLLLTLYHSGASCVERWIELEKEFAMAKELGRVVMPMEILPWNRARRVHHEIASRTRSL
jgi:hypothetical protein